MGVAVFIRSIAAVLNAVTRLLQAALRLTKIIVTFFKNPSHTRSVDRLFKKSSSCHFVFKKRPLSNFRQPPEVLKKLRLVAYWQPLPIWKLTLS